MAFVVPIRSDSDIVDSLQGGIVPSLQSNHGEDCIDEIRTIRVLGVIRREHNYLPMVNMTGALLSEGWEDEAIFVG